MEESRDLLVVATSRVFSNLARLQPLLDLEAVTAPVNVSDGAWAAAEAYAKKFDQVVVDEGDGDGEEDTLRTVRAPQEARRPELPPVARCA